jgi:hypothetical protein
MPKTLLERLLLHITGLLEIGQHINGLRLWRFAMNHEQEYSRHRIKALNALHSVSHLGLVLHDIHFE